LIDRVGLQIRCDTFKFASLTSLHEKAEGCIIQYCWGQDLVECSSGKYASVERVRFLIWCRSLKMAAMTSFHAVLPSAWCM